MGKRFKLGLRVAICLTAVAGCVCGESSGNSARWVQAAKANNGKDKPVKTASYKGTAAPGRVSTPSAPVAPGATATSGKSAIPTSTPSTTAKPSTNSTPSTSATPVRAAAPPIPVTPQPIAQPRAQPSIVSTVETDPANSKAGTITNPNLGGHLPISTPAVAVAASKHTCPGVEASYSLWLDGATYRVRSTGGSGLGRKLYFVGQNEVQVTDSRALGELAAAVWTYENVVASADARNASGRVSAAIGTLGALEKYTIEQDLVARAFVEAVEAAITGGASVGKAVPNLSQGILMSQMTNAPKTILALAAVDGLKASLAAYQQMDGVKLAPGGVLRVNDLAQMRASYVAGRTLELPFAALAAKLMPTNGGDFAGQFAASMLSELNAGPLGSQNPSTSITLTQVLELQTRVGTLGHAVPALQKYSEDLNLALSLPLAEKNLIANWAASAPQTCK